MNNDADYTASGVRHDYPDLYLLGAIIMGLICIGLVSQVYRAWKGRAGIPIFFILGGLLGGRLGDRIGFQMDAQIDELRESTGPNWGGLVFWGAAAVAWFWFCFSVWRGH